MSLNGCCCLCCSPFDTISSIKKRKLLHGSSASTELSILISIIQSKSPFATADWNPQLQKGYLCVICQRTLLKVKRIQEELQTILQDINSKLSNIVQSTSIVQAGKRTSVPLNLVSKRARTTEAVTPGPSQCSVAAGLTEEQQTTKCSPNVTTHIHHKNYSKTCKITPNRKKAIASLSRRNYKAAATGITKIQQAKTYIVAEVAKHIRAEMKNICSLSHNSILRDQHEQLKSFSWESLLVEFKQNVPTLILLLQHLLPKADGKFLSFVVAVILKKRCKQMSLVQRVISVMLYGNATQKEVYKCLQPFMVCMSPSITTSIIDKISEDYDVEVKLWREKLKNLLNNEVNQHSVNHRPAKLQCGYDSDNSSSSSVVAPIWEPFSDCEDANRDDDDEWSDSNAVELEDVFEDDLSLDCLQSEGIEKEPSQVSLESCAETYIPLPPTSSCSPSNVTCATKPPDGFVLVGDNIDKNVRPSFQRRDYQTESWHCFHSYAVANRVDISQLSDEVPSAVVSPDSVLPSSDDLVELYKEFEVLVSRIIVQHMDRFKGQVSDIKWHIESQHSQEMASQSKVIPLGIQFHNEAKITEMCNILDALDTYVPAIQSTETILFEDEEYEVDATKVHQLLLFGDQLTAARIRSASVIRCTTDTGALDKFEGFTPAIVDWHARATFLDVIWKRFYSAKSVAEKGTLYQLKVLINRSAVKSVPSKNVKPTEDFLLLILHSYVIAAAEQCQKSSDTHQLLSQRVVQNFVKIHLPNEQESELFPCDDMLCYSTDLLTFCLLWHGFHDATREGDGDRILRYWRFLTVIFQQEGHYNYAKEGLTLAIQSQVLSDRKVSELKWSRTVNISGCKGHNIPCDLHMEHLNARLKKVMANVGSNKLLQPFKRVAKSLGVVHTICQKFASESDVSINKPYHSYPSFSKDFDSIMRELRAAHIFSVIPQRKLVTFTAKPLLNNLKWKNITEWTKDKIINFTL